MMSGHSNKISKATKILIRGIIYAFIAIVGLILEMFVLKEFRPVILFGYSLVFLIALYYIFILRKKQDTSST
ncbi:hypothetical protein JW964_21425 [candidate division KSB1 bacterium]|nr:hypothetical protein [candidate division KSB1 bacterium]